MSRIYDNVGLRITRSSVSCNAAYCALHNESCALMAESSITTLETAARGLLGDARFGRPLRWLDTVSSTNSLARSWAQDGADEGATVVADYQTAGKGRHGRKWDSERGQNLTLSIVLRPVIRPDQLGMVTIAASLAVADTLSVFVSGGKVGIKWPNDVRIDGLKCCGMLLESVLASGSDSVAVVLGIGLNVNQMDFNDGLEDTATSMALSAGRRLDRTEVLVRLLQALEKRMVALPGGTSHAAGPRADALRRDYEDLLEGRNGRVRFRDVSSGEEREGRVRGIAADGGLEILRDGVPITLHAGEVTLVDIA